MLKTLLTRSSFCHHSRYIMVQPHIREMSTSKPNLIKWAKRSRRFKLMQPLARPASRSNQVNNELLGQARRRSESTSIRSFSKETQKRSFTSRWLFSRYLSHLPLPAPTFSRSLLTPSLRPPKWILTLPFWESWVSARRGFSRLFSMR